MAMTSIRINSWWKWFVALLIPYLYVLFVNVTQIQIFNEFIFSVFGIYFVFLFAPILIIFCILNVMYNTNKKEKYILCFTSLSIVIAWITYIYYSLINGEFV